MWYYSINSILFLYKKGKNPFLYKNKIEFKKNYLK